MTLSVKLNRIVLLDFCLMPNESVIPIKQSCICLLNITVDKKVYFILIFLNSKTMVKYMEV